MVAFSVLGLFCWGQCLGFTNFLGRQRIVHKGFSISLIEAGENKTFSLLV